MTEAEILAVRIGTAGLIISIVSVSFGMISAYIVGLWLFLRRVPLFLRLVAFSLLSCGLAFMGGLAWGMHGLLLGTDRAWTKLSVVSSEIPDFGGSRIARLFDLSLYEVFVILGIVVFVAIYLALAYVTFVYRWPDQTADREPIA